VKPVDCEPLYRDGRHYDAQHRDYTEDIPFYLRQAARFGSPILELACGTGRITLPLAEQGFSVTGLDISEGMLARARAKARDRGLAIDWVQADCREFTLDKRFALIFFPFNSIAHLHNLESLRACFARVREHLAPGGRFVIDIFNPRLDYLTRDPAQRHPVDEYPDPDGRGQVTITETLAYDRASQISHIVWYYSIGDRHDALVEELNMRIFFPQELDALLICSGLTLEAKYGDYDERPFASDSPKQLPICR
jgi:SAM-dependent methyltransferase